MSILRAQLALVVALCCDISVMGENSSMLMTPREELREKLYITEVCINPPKDSDWPSWIEIWNNSKQTMDLGGYSIETLQAVIKPFGRTLPLKPDQRCVLEVYPGETISTNFWDVMGPSPEVVVRCMGTKLFPSSFSAEEWWALMKSSLADDAPVDVRTNIEHPTDEREVKGVNALSLRDPKGELVAYLCWGGRYLSNTKAGQEAGKANLFHDSWSESLQSVADSDARCGVVQMLSPGFYGTVRDAEVNATPGRPMVRTTYPAKVKLPIKCKFRSISFHTLDVVQVEVGLDDQRLYSDFEKWTGWARPMPEFFYDRDMTQSVFGGPVQSIDYGRYLGWSSSLFRLQPEVFFFLANRPLYCRVVKINRTRPSVYSEVQEVRLCLDTNVFYEIDLKKAGSDRFVVKLKSEDSAVKTVAENLAKCNTAYTNCNSYQRYAQMEYNFADGGREVVVEFGAKKYLDDISFLSGLPIKRLDLSESRVGDISGLKGMPLQTLNLRGSKVKDIAPLKGLPLRFLDISGTEVADVSPLVDCPLVQLRFDTKKIKNLEVLMRDGKKVKREENGETTAIEWPTDFSAPVGFDSSLVPRSGKSSKDAPGKDEKAPQDAEGK